MIQVHVLLGTWYKYDTDIFPNVALKVQIRDDSFHMSHVITDKPIFLGELVDDLNMQLKKSGRLNADTRMLDIEFNDQTPVERVAISSKQHGKFWKHESCRASGKTGPPKHKYICEL